MRHGSAGINIGGKEVNAEVLRSHNMGNPSDCNHNNRRLDITVRHGWKGIRSRGREDDQQTYLLCSAPDKCGEARLARATISLPHAMTPCMRTIT